MEHQPPPPPGPPVERHPYNDDWGSTLVAILLMSLIVFVALGILVKRSFRLVPTGVLALGTLLGGRSDGVHHLADDSDGEAEHGPSEDATRITVPDHPPAEAAQQRLQLANDDSDDDDDEAPGVSASRLTAPPAARSPAVNTKSNGH